MTDINKSLWPSAIKPEVMSPMEILTIQAEALAEQTKGVLKADVSLAEVRVRDSKEKLQLKEVINFDIVAPILEEYRHRILAVSYNKGLPYPATVESSGLDDLSMHQILGSITVGKKIKPYNQANNDEEFFNLVKQVFTSEWVISIAQSLILQARNALGKNPRANVSSQPGATPFLDGSTVSNESVGQGEEDDKAERLEDE
jgi:hypothetical protein